MKSPKRYLAFVAVGLLVSGGAQIANASLVANGTFDTDLSGWSTAGTTTGVTWVSGTAHVGRKGTPGVAIFAQSFDIVSGTDQLAISFDYEWQINRPNISDTFLVELVYKSTSGIVTESLLSQSSDDGIFSPPAIAFSTVISLSNLDDVSDNGTIRFTLTETNTSDGTRIELDNVSVEAVPEATTIVIWSLLGVVGMAITRRRR